MLIGIKSKAARKLRSVPTIKGQAMAIGAAFGQSEAQKAPRLDRARRG